MTRKAMFQGIVAAGLLLGGVGATRAALACSCPAGQSLYANPGQFVATDGSWHTVASGRAQVEGGSGPYGTILFVDLISGACAYIYGANSVGGLLSGCSAEDDTADGSSAEANGPNCSGAAYMWSGAGWCM